jgi:hypothetical protein
MSVNQGYLDRTFIGLIELGPFKREPTARELSLVVHSLSASVEQSDISPSYKLFVDYCYLPARNGWVHKVEWRFAISDPLSEHSYDECNPHAAFDN